MTDPTHDRRGEPRVEAAHLVSYSESEEQALTKLGIGATVDVSETGLRFWCTEPMAEDHQLRLEVAIGEEVLHLDARVVHHEQAEDNRHLIGVEFEDIGVDTGEVLSRYVKARRGEQA